ncbi:MAG: RNA 2',3'-cyclic phosphodiesterase [Actinobacteria bacterium]|nr:RNA 2',3'-cyclic phosphodiesterase [Actinomycetota bacterium]
MNGDGETKLRVFIGLPLSREVRRYVADIAQELSRRISEVRWVAPENLHVTLKFIGACDGGKVTGIVKVIKESAAYLPITLKVGGIGGFPSQGSARVIWVGAEDGEKKINELYKSLDKGAGKLGFPREKRTYKPHITVGRARKKPVSLPPELDIEAGPDLTLEVNDIVLFRSVLKKTGAEYSVIERVGVRQNI